MSKIVDVLKCKCPKCTEGNVFNDQGNILLLRMPKMNVRCTVCNFKFERETGFFFGAMFVSYALAVMQMVTCFVLLWYIIDLSPLHVFTIIAIIAVLLSTVNFRISRSIWIYLFYRK